jgi:hypothetical protein
MTIFSFPMHEYNPAVVHLAIHLENGQSVYFTDANVQQRALNLPGTTLTAFLTLCQDVFRSVLLLHVECNKKAFERRRRGEPVDSQPGIFRENTNGRLYTVHPNLDECLSLRMLLVNLPGPSPSSN